MLRKHIIFLILILLPFYITAQGFQEREVEPYSEIKIFGNIKASLILGEEPKVRIKTEGIDPDVVKTKSEEGELQVRVRKGLFKKSKKVFVEIYFQDLDAITTLADADVTVEKPIIQPVFELKATSGSHVKMAIESENLEIRAYQGGQGEIKGKTDTLNAYVNTGGILSATDLIVKKAKIKMNTGGKGEITVKKKLKARINTGADFSYFGEPDIKDINTSFGGTISAWDEENENQ